VQKGRFLTINTSRPLQCLTLDLSDTSVGVKWCSHLTWLTHRHTIERLYLSLARCAGITAEALNLLGILGEMPGLQTLRLDLTGLDHLQPQWILHLADRLMGISQSLRRLVLVFPNGLQMANMDRP
jgi:hypothetical protein